MSKEEKKTYTIKSDENLGEVKIADEVVAIIAGLAAMEVEGVQEKVKAAIENMTGLEVADVNIRVAGVDVPEEA